MSSSAEVSLMNKKMQDVELRLIGPVMPVCDGNVVINIVGEP